MRNAHYSQQKFYGGISLCLIVQLNYYGSSSDVLDLHFVILNFIMLKFFIIYYDSSEDVPDLKICMSIENGYFLQLSYTTMVEHQVRLHLSSIIFGSAKAKQLYNKKYIQIHLLVQKIHLYFHILYTVSSSQTAHKILDSCSITIFFIILNNFLVKIFHTQTILYFFNIFLFYILNTLFIQQFFCCFMISSIMHLLNIDLDMKIVCK